METIANIIKEIRKASFYLTSYVISVQIVVAIPWWKSIWVPTRCNVILDIIHYFFIHVSLSYSMFYCILHEWKISFSYLITSVALSTYIYNINLFKDWLIGYHKMEYIDVWPSVWYLLKYYLVVHTLCMTIIHKRGWFYTCSLFFVCEDL